MAQINYDASIETFQELWDTIDDVELTVKRNRDEKVIVEDADGNRLEFQGKNLDYTAEGGFEDGTIKKIELTDENGRELFEIKNIRIDATAMQAAFDDGGLQAVLNVALAGDDDVEGSKGNDRLVGLEGRDEIEGEKGSDYLAGGLDNDLLIGGKGHDYFVFEEDGSRDVVKDFDVGGRNGDFIAVDAELVASATWEQEGKNLVVDFGGEGTIVLKNVDAEDFTADHIVALPEANLV